MSEAVQVDEELVAHLNLAALRMASFELEGEAEALAGQMEPGEARGMASVTGSSASGSVTVTVSILMTEHSAEEDEGSGEGGPEV